MWLLPSATKQRENSTASEASELKEKILSIINENKLRTAAAYLLLCNALAIPATISTFLEE